MGPKLVLNDARGILHLKNWQLMPSRWEAPKIGQKVKKVEKTQEMKENQGSHFQGPLGPHFSSKTCSFLVQTTCTHSVESPPTIIFRFWPVPAVSRRFSGS